ncbi:hypothetical protein V1525DRAFT_428486 [Lipomyces kononenkoae]|uniref:Uncharacterized protein n=1 Tax=Lipomyces kononenkoae TaxID=34357 RepID=A0ACC3SS59_LIPKO
MAQSDLLATVRRPLSSDAYIEVPASRSEYELVQDILEEEDAKYPTLQYDGFQKVAIVSGTPSPLHGDMAGELVGRISRSIERMPGIDQNIKYGLSTSNERSNTRGAGDASTTRNWDGALTYMTREGEALMVAVEVGLSQTIESLRAAISYSVCTLRCRVGIALSINECGRGTAPTVRYYDTADQRSAAIRDIKHTIESQVQTNPFGPLRIGEETWFGKVTKVLLETYRLEDETSPPETLLDPKQSFSVDDCRKWAEVPPNLAEITFGDCVPTHILTSNNIGATPVNFFEQDWFENRFQLSMLRTAMERVWSKSKVVRV